MATKLLLLLFLTLVALIVFVIIIGRKAERSLVHFDTSPNAEVFVDGIDIGRTPLDFETKKRNILIKLQVSSSEGSFLPYETALSLTPQTETIVRRSFSENSTQESFSVFQFVKSLPGTHEMTIVTDPVGFNIYLNNELKGQSPLSLSPPLGQYEIKISKTLYGEKTFSVQNALGYMTFVFYRVGRQGLREDNSQSLFATVLKTSEGFLNVRKEPTQTSTEMTRILPGREYRVLGFDVKHEWIDIELNASESGWINARYATVSAQIATPP